MKADWSKRYAALPRLLEGQTAWVIGGGPSLRSFDPHLLKGRAVVVTNEAFSLYPNAVALVFVDLGWWQRRGAKVRESFNGLIVARGPYRNDYKGLHNVGFRSGLTWSREPWVLGGNNSGLAAINAAFLMGAERAVLLGFDMRAVEGRHNYHKLHGHEGPGNRYRDKFMRHFEQAAKAARHDGFEVVNATPGSALECFEKREASECLADFV